jgi:epoxyqueuosine reductase
VGRELPEVIHTPQMPFSCETCRACVKNCPTGAIQLGQPMDARKCISYLTIEKRDVLMQEEGRLIGDWLFGCDACTTVCPPRDVEGGRIPIDLEWLFKTSAAELRRIIKGNAASYAGVTQLRKNGVIVLKNMGSERARELLDWVHKNAGSERDLQQLSLG